MSALSRVPLFLVLGLVLLGLVAYLCLYGLQRDLIEEALAEQGQALERSLEGIIARFAGELAADRHGTLREFGERLVMAVESNPAIIDLVVVDPARRVVRAFSRRTGPQPPCMANFPLTRRMDRVHPPGELESGTAVACRSLPVFVEGRHLGAVFFHAKRDWRADSARVGSWVRRTALRMAPVFVVFYLLLGAMLLAATRAAQRWRRRAETAARVESLGALASGINHEIKNPLNTVGLSLQYLGRRHPDDETREVVASAEREAKRIRSTLDEFARFTRVSRLKTAPLDIGAHLRDRFGHRRRVRIRGEARAEVDLRQLDDALDAVVDVLEGQGADGTVELELGMQRGHWRLRARGEAPGLDATGLARLFDPYVRARPRDVGRGLALARAIFQAHGGDLVARRRGSRLILTGDALRAPGTKGDR